MEIIGNTIILDAGDKITIEAREKGEPQPEPYDERMTFGELVDEFNKKLVDGGHWVMVPGMEVYRYLEEVYRFADTEWNDDSSIYFNADSFPLVYDYRGTNTMYRGRAYNAMQAMLMAMYLVEAVPDGYGEMQTSLYQYVFDVAGFGKVPMAGLELHSDPYVVLQAAGFMWARTKALSCPREKMQIFRGELGGQMIPGTTWADLGYERTELVNDDGDRMGYRVDACGYVPDARFFIPSVEWPRVAGTVICGEPKPVEPYANSQFYMDYKTDVEMVDGWNIGSETPIEEWEGYPREKQQRLIQVCATPPCTYMYMFGKEQRIRFTGIEYKAYDGEHYGNHYCFEPTDEDMGLSIAGPFRNLAGIFRYNVHDGEETAQELFIKRVLEIADNCRFPVYDPNYGRRRPCGADSIKGGARSDVPGAKENAIYNVDIACMVADTEEQREKWSHEDGFVTEKPNSYPSGHSSQIYMMAVLLASMDADNLEWYMQSAYEYSVNRSIGRFHWISDCIVGRIMGVMMAPVVCAMEGLQDGFDAMREWIEKRPEPHPVGGDIHMNIVIHNGSGRRVTLNGELCLVLANPDRNGVYYGWEGCYNRTGHIRYIPMDEGLAIEDGDTVTCENVPMDNSEVVVGGRNPLDADRLGETDYKSNVLLYDADGDSSTVYVEPLASFVEFVDGLTVHLEIS